MIYAIYKNLDCALLYIFAVLFAVFPSDTIGFWIGARRARGSHSGSCMYNQWRWTDFYGRTFGTIAGFGAFVPDKPDK